MAPRLMNFIDAYGYRDMIDKLASQFDGVQVPPDSGKREALKR